MLRGGAWWCGRALMCVYACLRGMLCVVVLCVVYMLVCVDVWWYVLMRGVGVCCGIVLCCGVRYDVTLCRVVCVVCCGVMLCDVV